jgi:hypothetical protein
MKIYPVGAQLFRAGGQTDRRMEGRTDMTKLIISFRNFVNALENGSFSNMVKLVTELSNVFDRCV